MAGTLRALLRGWAIDDGGVPLFEEATLDTPLQGVRVGERPPFLRIAGPLPEATLIHVPRDLPADATVLVRCLSAAPPPEDVALCVMEPSPHVVFAIGGSRVRLATGRSPALAGEINAWNDSRLLLGDGTSCNGMRIVLDRSTVVIGRDGLISSDVLIQSHDQHGLVDLDTLALLNDAPARTVIGAHVWLGRRSVVMPDVTIGAGSVIGTGAVVTQDVPPFCVAAGVPARILRERTSWSRSPAGPSAAERAWLDPHRTA
jgi:acetyltransferase-like isoleucine patch superfamily enzyme